MRCPACGYHSFEHMEKCKKCGADLKEFKAKYGFLGRFFIKPSEEDLKPPENEEKDPEELVSLLADLDYKKEVEDFEVPEPQLWDSETPDETFLSEDVSETSFPVEEQMEEKEEAAREEIPGEEAFDGTMEDPEEPFIFDVEESGSTEKEDNEELLGLNEERQSVPDEQEIPEELGTPHEVSREEKIKVFEADLDAFEDIVREEQPQLEDVAETTPLPLQEEREEGFVKDDSVEEETIFPEEKSEGIENQIFPRLGAYLADCSILSVILLAFVVLGKVGLDSQPRQGLFPTQAALLVELLIPYFFLFFALCFGYFTVFHFLTGQTPGKMLFHIRVEDENGFPLLFSQAFLRSTGGLLSFLLLGFGYLMIFFNPERRGWNDRLAGTRVVRVDSQ